MESTVDKENVRTFVEQVRADYGGAYVAVVRAACQYYHMLAHNNGIDDPYQAPRLEAQQRHAWQLSGMVTAAAAILKSEPYQLEPDHATQQAKDDIRMMAAVLSGTAPQRED